MSIIKKSFWRGSILLIKNKILYIKNIELTNDIFFLKYKTKFFEKELFFRKFYIYI